MLSMTVGLHDARSYRHCQLAMQLYRSMVMFEEVSGFTFACTADLQADAGLMHHSKPASHYTTLLQG